MKLLVVDDSSTMLRIITNTLNRIGYKDIIKAENGEEALNKFNEEGDIEMILTDWNMPIMNGLTLVKEIRKINDDIPIVMITTEGAKADVITALKAGANNYIVKPFTPAILKEKLLAILN